MESSSCEASTSSSAIRCVHRLSSNAAAAAATPEEPLLSASAESALTISPMDIVFDNMNLHHPGSPEQPSSPHSGVPSSPGSPSGDSLSSFPSVSSSFLFSSRPASPPHYDLHPRRSVAPSAFASDSEMHDSTQGLIIPSLTLPPPVRRPTPYGRTLGDIRILILGPRGAASSALASQLLDDNDDIVEIGVWEEQVHTHGQGSRVMVLRASTDWIEHRDAHGLEHAEPSRNVEVVELPAYDPEDDLDTILQRVLPVVHAPFLQISEALNPDYAPSAVLANLLSSSCTTLYTTMIVLPHSSPTPTERDVIASLSAHIPLIAIPPIADPVHHAHAHDPHTRSRHHSHPHPHSHSHSHGHHHRRSRSRPPPISPAALSAFRPYTAQALRIGLFRSPETLALLRAEGAARFLRWREVERAVERVHAAATTAVDVRTPRWDGNVHGAWGAGKRVWDKARWEAEWDGSLSQDVAVHLRRRRASTASKGALRATPLQRTHDVQMLDDEGADERSESALPCARVPSFDPLHLPSLFVFSLSLLGPLRTRLARSLGSSSSSSSSSARTKDREVQLNGEGSQERQARGGGMGFGLGFGLGLALVGAFCAGIGLGVMYSGIRFA